MGRKNGEVKKKMLGRRKGKERKMFGLVSEPADFIKDQGIKPLGSLFL